MRKTFGLFLVVILSVVSLQAQELNCTVTVGHDKVNVTNKQIFTTLERSLNEFMNTTKWTTQRYNQNEKIECGFFINVTALSGGTFTATLQIQSSRPVYGTSYSTPIFNYLDKDFVFQYNEFENLFFNPNSFDSNLTAVLAYYANIIIGLDADSFKLNEGTANFEAASSIVNLGQSSGYKGWSQSEGGLQNRFFLTQDLLSNSYDSFRKAMYEYHIKGIDLMSDSPKNGKEGIKKSIATLSEINKRRPNAFLTRIFFDAKADEIVSVFSGGPSVPTADLQENLEKLSPLNMAKWMNIKM